MKVGIIIQSRLDSKRFPNKAIKQIGNMTLLGLVIERCKKLGERVIVATSNRKIDDPIVEIAKKHEVDYFRGSTEDVLDRYYQTAKSFSLDIIVRITGDCPLLDPNESKKVIIRLKNTSSDYTALDDTTYPDGLDTECFTFKALEKAWNEAKLLSQREHVTPFIKDNPKKFKISIISSKLNLKNERWTVDYPDDLEFIKAVYTEFKNKDSFSMHDVVNLLSTKPELRKINIIHERNEGYKKSIENDMMFKDS